VWYFLDHARRFVFDGDWVGGGGQLSLVAGMSEPESSGPSIESAAHTLSGQLVYHDQYRQWFGLKLDAPVCGVREVQLVDLDRAGEAPEAQHLEVFRGCRVQTTGVLDVPGTTYFSAEVFQVVDKVETVASCIRRSRFPNDQAMHPARDVQRYRVLMRLNYRTNSPVHVSAHDGDRALRPPQVYAPYTINGGFSIAANCGEGFNMSGVRGTPAGKPSDMDGTAWIDPESAASKHIWNIYLSYVCRR
jgi:hypothetical protein